MSSMHSKYSAGSDNDSGLSIEKDAMSSFSSNHSNTAIRYSGRSSQSNQSVFLKIYIVDISKHIKYQFYLHNSVFDVKRALIRRYGVRLVDPINFGLFIPHEVNKSGKFLQEERLLSEYFSGNSINRLEFLYKSRITWPDKSNGDSQKKINSKVNHNRFIDYIVRNDPEKVKKALNRGLDPNFHCASGETPLTLTAKLNKPVDVITALVAGGSHLDYRATDSMTPLHKAAIAGNYETLSTLLDFGASVNCVDAFGMTPLYYNLLYDSATKCMEKLLYEHAKLGVVDKRGLREIHQASRSGKSHHLDILLAYGADVNSRTEVHSSTPLHVAAYTGQEDCVRLLLVRGADRNLLNSSGRTAAQEARITSYTNLSNLIKEFQDSEIHVKPAFNPLCNPRRKRCEFDVSSCHLRMIKSNSNNLDDNTSNKSGALTSSSSERKSRKKSVASGSLKRGNNKSAKLKERCASQGAISKSISYNVFSDPDDTSGSSDHRIKTNSNREERKKQYRDDCWKHCSMASLDSDSLTDSDISALREVVLQKPPNSDYGIDLDDSSSNSPSEYVIKNITIGSPAFLVGLRCEDYLIEVNGVDVRHAPIHMVKQLFLRDSSSVVLKVLHGSSHSDASTDPSLHYKQFTYHPRGEASKSCRTNHNQYLSSADTFAHPRRPILRNSASVERMLSNYNLSHLNTAGMSSTEASSPLCLTDGSAASSSHLLGTTSSTDALASNTDSIKRRNDSADKLGTTDDCATICRLRSLMNCGESSTTLNSVCTMVASSLDADTDSSSGVPQPQQPIQPHYPIYDPSCYTLGRKRSQSTDKKYQKNTFNKTDTLLKYRPPLTPSAKVESLKPILKQTSSICKDTQNEWQRNMQNGSQQSSTLMQSSCHTFLPLSSFNSNQSWHSHQKSTNQHSASTGGAIKPIHTDCEPKFIYSNSHKHPSSNMSTFKRDPGYLKLSTSEEDFCLPPPVSFQ